MEVVEEFVKNKSGKATYRSWLNCFFEAVDYLELVEQKGTHKKYKVKKNIDNYFNDKRNYDEDAVVFGNFIKDWAPGTRKGAISCLKNFLMFNNIRLQPKTEYQLREIQKGPKAVTIEIVPDRKILKEILSYGNVLHKSLFLVMASSGMRPGETVSITFDDIHLNQTPVKIDVPYQSTRTKEPRITFISSEAKHWVEQWLKIRSKYIASKRNKVQPEDNRVFPIAYNNLKLMWIGLIEKAGYDACDERNGKIKKRHKMTPQKLRKFFKTSLSDASIPFEVVEALMGHEEGMSAVYRRYTEKQLRDWYLKGEPSLLVFEKPVNQEEVDELRKQMAVLQEQMMSILDMKEEVEKEEDTLIIEPEVEATFNPNRKKVVAQP